MCGVAGWFSRSPLTADADAALAAMMLAIRHRGPDGTGYVLRRHAALGHTRLAIIDIAGGSQPMSTPDESITVAFNGEIYNFQDIRHDLEQTGFSFRSRSDTEVLLHLYRRDGWQGFSRLRGMYAFAIWDESSHSGLLVRDPAGIKPLFFDHRSDRLVFSSEAKAILAIPGFETRLDYGSLHLALNFRYLPGRRSLFSGIEQLPPGAVLEWTLDGSCREHRLQLASSDSEQPLSALRGSVRAHLTSDVEVGSYLSGGIDSAIITALANHTAHTPLRTFTLQAGDDPNEANYAARTAELIGSTNIQSAFSRDVSDSLPRLIWHLEVPKINALQVHELAILARRYVKVVLSGLGGDELFLGYNAHRILAEASWLAAMVPSRLSRTAGSVGSTLVRAARRLPWSESERGLVMLRELGNWPAVYGVLRNVWDSPAMRQRVYGPRMLDNVLPDAFSVIEELWPDQRDPVLAMAEFEWCNKMVNDLLWQEDRVSMAEGLEVRVPFVDWSVRQSVNRLPRHTLMPAGKPKGYMRAMVRGHLPDEIIDRPKSGFQVDAPNFFWQYLERWTDPYLTYEYTRRVGLFNPVFVDAIRHYSVHKRTRWHYFMLYLILGTHLWVEIFENRQWPARN